MLKILKQLVNAKPQMKKAAFNKELYRNMEDAFLKTEKSKVYA